MGVRTRARRRRSGPGVRAGRHGGVEHPAGQDARHGEEEAYREHRGGRAEDQRLRGRPALPPREREERQRGGPQAGVAQQGLGGIVVADDRQQIIDEFGENVNMSLRELEEWLQTDESKSVGQSDGGGESKGHESGRRIVEILEKDDKDIGQDDVDHMRRVVSYVNRHQAQEPEEDVEDSRWRYSLMNWGHDPLK